MGDFIRKTVDGILYVINTSTWLVERALTINYNVMSYVVTLAVALFSRALDALNLIVYTIRCLLEDFSVFWKDLSSIFTNLTGDISNFCSTVVNLISNFFTNLYLAFQYGIDLAVSTVWGIWQLILQCFWGIYYGVMLIFSSILLILQLIPQLCLYLLMGGYDLTKQVTIGIKDTVTNINNRICSSVNNAYSSTVTNIQNIPVDALVGLLLAIILAIMMRKAVFYFYRRSLRAIAIRILFLCLKGITKAGTRTYNIAKRGINIVFWKLRHDLDPSDSDDDMQGEVVYRCTRPVNNRRQGESSRKTEFKKCCVCSGVNEGDQPICERCMAKRLEEELQTEREVRVCVACQDTIRSILLLPCRHLCLCRNCLDMVLEVNGNCPVCRQGIVHAIPVYM